MEYSGDCQFQFDTNVRMNHTNIERFLGGYVVISMREENRREVNEYKEQDKVFAAYEQEGLWKKISETVTKNYYMNYDGLVLVYQVTQH